MIKVGLHSNFWGGTEIDANLMDMLKLTADIGGEVFECGTIAVAAMSTDKRRELRKIAEDFGIALTLNGGVSGEADMSSRDTVFRQASIEMSKRAIETAHDVGAKKWSGVIYSRWLATPPEPFTAAYREAMWARALESVRDLIPLASGADVDICFEIVNRFEQYMLTTTDEGLAFTEAVGDSHAKLLLDVFHMSIEENSITGAIKTAASHGKLGHIHVSEANRRPPGIGDTDMDWDGILHTIANCGYEGFVVLEPMALMKAPMAHKFRIWRNVVEDDSLSGMRAVAKKSLDFVKERLNA
jgi:D-psicose/D-tagatose/L-ribulose 3-epimerase